MLVKEQLHRTVPHVLQGNVKIFFPLVPVNHVMLFIPFIHINADIVQAIKNQLPGILERYFINTDILDSASSRYTHMLPPFIN